MTKDLDTGFHFLLYAHQNKPLKLWDKRIRAGYIYQMVDQDMHCPVLEMVSLKSSRTYITCPADPKKVLGIRAPFLHITVKNLQRSVVIDFLIKDCKNVKRRFRAMTKQTSTQVKPYVCKMPLTLENGWNKIVVPLNEYTVKAYGTKYVEALRVQIHATCRVQGVYFSYSPDYPMEMPRLSQQQGFLSILHNIGTKPLLLWSKKIRAGHIARVADDDLGAYVIELLSFTPKNTYITCPEDQAKTLGVRLPVLNLTVKNLDEPFSISIQILDAKDVKRRFIFSTDHQYTWCKPMLCVAPLILQEGWNEISLNLQALTKKVFRVGFKETLRLQINASCRLKRVFFSGKVPTEEELPGALRLHNIIVVDDGKSQLGR